MSNFVGSPFLAQLAIKAVVVIVAFFGGWAWLAIHDYNIREEVNAKWQRDIKQAESDRQIEFGRVAEANRQRIAEIQRGHKVTMDDMATLNIHLEELLRARPARPAWSEPVTKAINGRAAAFNKRRSER